MTDSGTSGPDARAAEAGPLHDLLVDSFERVRGLVEGLTQVGL